MKAQDHFKDLFTKAYPRLARELGIGLGAFADIELVALSVASDKGFAVAHTRGRYTVAYQFADEGGRFWKKEFPTFDLAFRALQGVIDRNLPDTVSEVVCAELVRRSREREYGIALVSVGEAA